MYQFLKSLECLRYQMTEGTIPDTWEYQALGMLIDELAIAIVHSRPEYAAATWD